MPSIFKALATITVWVLFILGLFTVVITFVFMNIAQSQAAYAGPPPMQASINLAIGVASMVLAVVVMKLRKELE